MVSEPVQCGPAGRSKSTEPLGSARLGRIPLPCASSESRTPGSGHWDLTAAGSADIQWPGHVHSQPAHARPHRRLRHPQPPHDGADDAQPRPRRRRAVRAGHRVLRAARVGRPDHHRGRRAQRRRPRLRPHAGHRDRRADRRLEEDHGRRARQGRPHVHAVHARRPHRPLGQPLHQRAAGGAARPSAPTAQIWTDAHGLQDMDTPRALETSEIPGVIEGFAQATRNALEAGFDGVELHAASGYLPMQFLSTGTNTAHRRLRRQRAEPHPVRRRNARGDDRAPPASPAKVGDEDQPGHPVQRHPRRRPDRDLHGAGEGRRADGPRLPARAAHAAAAATSSRCCGRSTPARSRSGGGFDFASGNAAIASGLADFVVFGKPFTSNPDLAERFAGGPGAHAVRRRRRSTRRGRRAISTTCRRPRRARRARLVGSGFSRPGRSEGRLYVLATPARPATAADRRSRGDLARLAIRPSGVWPRPFLTFTAAPAATRRDTTRLSPPAAAACSAVSPA